MLRPRGGNPLVLVSMRSDDNRLSNTNIVLSCRQRYLNVFKFYKYECSGCTTSPDLTGYLFLKKKLFRSVKPFLSHDVDTIALCVPDTAAHSHPLRHRRHHRVSGNVAIRFQQPHRPSACRAQIGSSPQDLLQSERSSLAVKFQHRYRLQLS